MADLADIVKRHSRTDNPECIWSREETARCHADRAALIAMVNEAHAALQPFAVIGDDFSAFGPMTKLVWKDETRIRLENMSSDGEPVTISLGDLREAARVFVGRE